MGTEGKGALVLSVPSFDWKSFPLPHPHCDPYKNKGIVLAVELGKEESENEYIKKEFRFLKIVT